MEIATLLSIASLLFSAAALSFFIWLFYRLKKLFRGKEIINLEEYINTLSKKIEGLEDSRTKILEDITTLKNKMEGSVRGMGVIRFNSFSDVGGNQSFAVALLDERGNGIVFSSLYIREKTSVFAKPVKNYVSEYELTKEEKEAIKKARV